MIVDPETGKARIEVTVTEGAQYRLGDFLIEGNSRFPSDQLSQIFTTQRRSVLGLPFGAASERERGEVFDRAALNAATERVQQLYKQRGVPLRAGRTRSCGACRPPSRGARRR